MKILYVTHAYPPHGSGVGSFVQSAARGLVARGHQVWVVEAYHPSHGMPVGDRVDEGVHVRVFGEGFLPFRWMSGSTSKARALRWMAYKTKIFLLLFLLRSWRCGRYVRRLANALDADIVEVADGNESGLLASVSGRTVLVVRVHGSVHLQEAAGVKAFSRIERKVYKRIERGLMRRADAVVGVSRFVANLARQLFSLPKAVPVIYNMVSAPPQSLSHAHGSNEVLFVGRIGYDKGVDTLGKAWSETSRRFPELTLVVLGAGDREMLLAGMDDDARARVEFKGSLPKEEVLRHMARCRLFVLPSRYESFSIALLEALSMGCPIIYTERCSGHEVIADGENGLLINPDDAEALASAMQRILADEALRQRLMTGAAASSKRFMNDEEWLDENERFYEAVLEKVAAPRP